MSPRSFKHIGYKTRRLESLRYVAQTFLSAGSGDFPVACPSPTFNHTPRTAGDHGAFKKVSEQGDEAVPAPFLNAPWLEGRRHYFLFSPKLSVRLTGHV